MKKLFIILPILCSVATSTFALDPKSTKTQTVNFYGQYVPASEAEMYKIIYDMKYKSYMDIQAKSYDSIGIDPAYFMDDIKKSNDCYADAFARALSVSDFEILMSNESSDALRDGIINNIAYKEATKCRDKYEPYLSGEPEKVITEYLDRKCKFVAEKADTEEELKQQMEKHAKCMAEAMEPILQKTGASEL